MPMIQVEEQKRTKLAIYQQSKNGNDYCGDAFFFKETADYFICALADGLGSGQEAYRSASHVMEMIRRSHDKEVDELITASNEMLKQGRGVVLTIFKVNFRTSVITYSNIGNITFRLLLPSGEVIQPIPTRGFLAGKKRKILKEIFHYEPNSLFTMYTDGISYFSMKEESLLAKQEPEVIVRHVERCTEVEDDATIIVGKLI